MLLYVFLCITCAKNRLCDRSLRKEDLRKVPRHCCQTHECYLRQGIPAHGDTYARGYLRQGIPAHGAFCHSCMNDNYARFGVREDATMCPK